MDFFIFQSLDHTNIAALPSNDVQHGEYVINGGLVISDLKLTKV